MIATMHSILRTPRLAWASTTVIPSLAILTAIFITKPTLAITLAAAGTALLVAAILNRRHLTKMTAAPFWGVGLTTCLLLTHTLTLAAASTSDWSLTMLTLSAGSLICASALASSWVVPGVHSPAVRFVTATLALFAASLIFLGIDRTLHHQTLLGAGAATIGILLIFSCGTILIQHQPKMNISYGVLMVGAGGLLAYLGQTTWHTIDFTDRAVTISAIILACALAIAQRFDNPAALTGIGIGAMLLPLAMPLTAGATLVAVIFLVVAGAGLSLESVNIIKEAMNTKTWAAITGSHRIITSTGSHRATPVKKTRRKNHNTPESPATGLPPQSQESPLSGRTPRAPREPGQPIHPARPTHPARPSHHQTDYQNPAPLTRRERRQQEQLNKRSR